MKKASNSGRILSALLVLATVGALVVLPAGTAAAATEYNWEWQNPLPQGNSLFDVSAADAGNAWAVGFNGAILYCDGTDWSIQHAEAGLYLRGVSALRADSVWATGYRSDGDGLFTGVILHFDGTSWSEIHSVPDIFLLDVFALGENEVWAVGDQGTILYYDGASWEEQESGASCHLFSVSALSSDEVWVAGLDVSDFTGTILHWDGTSWSEQLPWPDWLCGVHALDAGNVWAVGVNGVILHYDGSAWSEQETGTTMTMSNVAAADAGNAWAVGGGSDPVTEEHYYTILHFDGTSWSEQLSRSSGPDSVYGNLMLHGVSAVDAETVWTVGDRGVVLLSEDGGDSWSSQTEGQNDNLCGISSADDGSALAVGENGAVLHWNGTSWIPGVSGTDKTLREVAVLDAATAWAVGYDFDSNVILSWDGTSWSEQESGTEHSLRGVAALGADSAWAVGDCGTILHWDGTSWSEQESGTDENLEGVSALDAGNVWAAGGSGTVLHWDGTSWSEQETGYSDYLNSISATGAGDVWAAGSEGVILHWDGTSWAACESGTNADLWGLHAIDARDVWAVGDGGVVLHYDGLSWSRQESGTVNTLLGTCAVDTASVLVAGAGGNILRGSPAAPVIDSVSPASGPAGTTVALTGANYGSSRRDSSVSFGEAKASSYLSWSDDRVEVEVPEGVSGKVKVTVTTPGGTSNARDFTVTAPPTPVYDTWYLAEGTTAWGFSTYVTVANPNDRRLTARLTYMDPGAPASGNGVVATRDVTLPPLSQTTVDPRWDLGDTDFSTLVECVEGETIAADRTMFWTGEGYDPSRAGWHNSIGAASPATTWYLPEGSSAWGFETWTAVLNPSGTRANVTLTYMTADGPASLEKTVPAHSRATYSMASDIGAADASIRVSSDVPVVAERSVYRGDRREGSCSVGAASASREFFLAEGATGYDVGFTTWVLVQNPGGEPNDVNITYQTGSGPVEGPAFTMAPGSRRTVKVNDSVPPNSDVSTTVSGSRPLVAERAMYWDNGTGEAFHASVGLSAPGAGFLLPDGQASGGFETWTQVANPNPGAARVRITYLPQGGGKAVSFTDEIPPGTRRTYNMADHVTSGRASVLVHALDGARPVMVERAMYVNGRGAGTDSVGGAL